MPGRRVCRGGVWRARCEGSGRGGRGLLRSGLPCQRFGGQSRCRGEGGRVVTTRRVAGGVAASSVALIAGGLVLVYVDRDLVPADLSGWHFADVFGQVSNLAPVVVGLVLASRRPGNRIGWLLLVAGLGLGL